MNRLREFRESLGLQQKEFAERLHINKNTYNNYELGNREPNALFWASIALEFNVSTDYLLGISEDKTLYTQTPIPANRNERSLQLIDMLNNFTPAEIQRIIDFAKGLAAAREE